MICCGSMGVCSNRSRDPTGRTRAISSPIAKCYNGARAAVCFSGNGDRAFVSNGSIAVASVLIGLGCSGGGLYGYLPRCGISARFNANCNVGLARNCTHYSGNRTRLAQRRVSGLGRVVL